MPHRTAQQVKEHYEIEKVIADRLRNSSAAERMELYKASYDELFRRVPHHPLLVERSEAARLARTRKEFAALRPLVDEKAVFVEIGPGDCSVSIAMAEHVKKVYAADVSSEVTNDLNAPANFELVIFDGLRLPLPSESVDLAYSNQLMEHLHPDDSLEQLRSIFATLKPGGLYYCVTPNRLSGPHDVSRGFDPVATGLHLREFTVAELDRSFTDAGFRQTRVYLWVFGRGLKLPVGPFKMLESVVGAFPERVRRAVTFNRIARFILGIKFLAKK
jgi:SAM-dependent methyltransferase